MKIKSLLAGMFACAALVACSNNDLVEGDNNVGNPESNTAYMSVKIAMPSTSGARATENFEYGTAKEQTISNAYCFFFNEDGSFSTASALGAIPVTPSTGSPAGNVEAISTATVILGPTNMFPTQVVTLLNIGDEKYAELKAAAPSLTELVAETAQYNDGYATDNSFIMSNSTYSDGLEAIYSTKVDRSDFHASISESEGNAVTIYVERLAAKVSVEMREDYTDETPKTPGGDLKLVIDGWILNGTNKTSYYIKNLNSSWIATAPFAGWNNQTNFRSYWAQDPNYSDGTYPANFETGTIDDNPSNSLVYKSWDDKTDLKTPIYCLENTVDVDNAKNYANITHALVIGHYTLDGEPVVGKAFYIYANNEIFMEDALKESMANMPNIYKKTGEDKYEKLGTDDYKIVRAKTTNGLILADQVTIGVVNEDITYYKKAGENVEEYVDLAATNTAAQAAAGTASVYYEGKCYFPVKIEHLNATADGIGHIGVVRNHIYKLTVNSVKNLGVGVYNPGEVIVPGEELKKYYLSAELHILSWNVLSQDVDL